MDRRAPALAGSCLIAVVVIATAGVDLPQALRVVLGLLIVFLLPGFALVAAVLSDGRLTRSEFLLASVGVSIAITICAAIVLAALPVGLTRDSIGITLGCLTVLFSLVAGYRFHRTSIAERT
jgi:uncharacterized membrane protein